jgi:hypothetical protein
MPNAAANAGTASKHMASSEALVRCSRQLHQCRPRGFAGSWGARKTEAAAAAGGSEEQLLRQVRHTTSQTFRQSQWSTHHKGSAESKA